VLTWALCGLTACAHTQKDERHDIATDLEKRLYDFEEAARRVDDAAAEAAMKDVEAMVVANRKELELHPEASMLFRRVETAREQLVEVKKEAEERRWQALVAEAEARVRRPLLTASESAKSLLEGEPSRDGVAALRRDMELTRDALSQGRRDGHLEHDGPFATQIEAQLAALEATAQKIDRRLDVRDGRDALQAGQDALAKAEAQELPHDRLVELKRSRESLLLSRDKIGRAIADEKDLKKSTLPLGPDRAEVRLGDMVKLCDQLLAKIDKLAEEAQHAQRRLDVLSRYLAAKSPDQQKAVRRWLRKPDIITQRKGQTVWIFTDKQKSGRRTVRLFHEYVYDATGALVDEQTRRK